MDPHPGHPPPPAHHHTQHPSQQASSSSQPHNTTAQSTYSSTPPSVTRPSSALMHSTHEPDHPVPGPSTQGSLRRSRSASGTSDMPFSEGGDTLPGDRVNLAGRPNSSRPTSRGGIISAAFANPLPPLPDENGVLDGRMPSRMRTVDTHASNGNVRQGSAVDWVVPLNLDEKLRPRTVGERLQPTLDHARQEKDKYSQRAKMTGWALNIAIGLQVVLGSLTTGLSAATIGRQTQIMTAILGGLSTIVASYLARARGSNEPELSITRTKDLEHFIRECEAFQLDHGPKIGDDYNDNLQDFREKFEELLGNGNG
ncbi:hypothetical protein BDN72DRAFT_162644 [Pluteus cervinus]|uniref:Uncharacterized protein n=1 Tax=Pluteus cervinus TaxID=181527 RepID=A0ACD3AKS6_9AGAR|nr:hypothetical protein BDN72DRAFT_162644 [Pluteus cervinus]